MNLCTRVLDALQGRRNRQLPLLYASVLPLLRTRFTVVFREKFTNKRKPGFVNDARVENVMGGGCAHRTPTTCTFGRLTPRCTRVTVDGQKKKGSSRVLLAASRRSRHVQLNTENRPRPRMSSTPCSYLTDAVMTRPSSGDPKSDPGTGFPRIRLPSAALLLSAFPLFTTTRPPKYLVITSADVTRTDLVKTKTARLRRSD